jgi:CRP-like cAMP-binding protein
MELQQIINHIYTLPKTSAAKLEEAVQEVTYPKGHILLRADKVETDVYFIRKGIVRAYSIHNGNEVTFWFGHEGDTALSMRSYVQNKEGYEDIELLEESELYMINSHRLQELFKEDLHIANWGRKFAENELIKTEERLISRQFKSATERYSDLLKETPHLLQRVQLGHIASYLGITQVSLSRIRATIK